MSHLYLLLRNNKQSGPYSREILTALPLTEKDLVKIIGQKSGWFSPSEVDLPFVKFASLKHVPAPVLINEVPIQEAIVEEKGSREMIDHSIEELSRRVTEMRNQLKLVEKSFVAESPKNSSEKKGRNAPPKKHGALGTKRLVLAMSVLVIFSALMLFAFKFFPRQQHKQHVLSAPPTPKEESMAEEQPQDSFRFNDAPLLIGSTTTNTSTSFTQAKKPWLYPSKKKKQPKQKTSPSIQPQVNYVSQKETEVTEEPEPAIVTHINYIPVEEAKKTTPAKGIFKKYPDFGNSKKPITAESISELLPIKIVTTNYSWLKGVQGLTLTMTNNSSQFVKEAIVYVVYFSAQNRVIEKVTLNFTNLAPGKSQSIAAPDHTYAHHPGSQLASVWVVKTPL